MKCPASILNLIFIFKYRLFILLLAVLLLGSCGKLRKNKPIEISHDEYEFINQTFWELIISSPPCRLESMSMDENELYWSEYYSKLETSKYVFYLKDSLINPNKSEFKDIPNLGDFNQLNFDLFHNLSSKAKKFKIRENPTIFNIKMITEYQIDTSFKMLLSSENCLGEIEFSHVAFDKNKLKACIIQSILRKNCRVVYLICLEKQNEKWRAKRKINITR